MAWEQVSKGPRGCVRPSCWEEFPVIGINRTNICFNAVFRHTFTNGKFKGVYILIDKERRCLGFKIPTAEQIEEEEGWYSVSTGRAGRQTETADKHTYYTGSIKKVTSLFPDCVGLYFRAHLNPEQRIIEVDLSPSNRVK